MLSPWTTHPEDPEDQEERAQQELRDCKERENQNSLWSASICILFGNFSKREQPECDFHAITASYVTSIHIPHMMKRCTKYITSSCVIELQSHILELATRKSSVTHTLYEEACPEDPKETTSRD